MRCSKLDQITSITERIFALTMLSRFQSVHLKAVEQRGAKQTIWSSKVPVPAGIKADVFSFSMTDGSSSLKTTGLQGGAELIAISPSMLENHRTRCIVRYWRIWQWKDWPVLHTLLRNSVMENVSMLIRRSPSGSWFSQLRRDTSCHVPVVSESPWRSPLSKRSLKDAGSCSTAWLSCAGINGSVFQ